MARSRKIIRRSPIPTVLTALLAPGVSFVSTAHAKVLRSSSKAPTVRVFAAHFRSEGIRDDPSRPAQSINIWASDGMIPFMAEWPAATNQ